MVPDLFTIQIEIITIKEGYGLARRDEARCVSLDPFIARQIEELRINELIIALDLYT